MNHADRHYGNSFITLNNMGAVLTMALVIQGCTPPIGVTKVTPVEAYKLATQSPLTGDGNSNEALAVLQRYNLYSLYQQNPGEALSQLHQKALVDDRRDILFALAELNYSWAETLEPSENSRAQMPSSRDVYLQAAVYAYLYLLGKGSEAVPSAFDNRFRDACELYNRALDLAFREGKDDALVFKAGKRNLPSFPLSLSIKSDSLHWPLKSFDAFYPADAYDIHGFSTHNRTPGLGAPIIGVTRKSNDAPNGGALPVTAFLKIDGGISDLGQEKNKVTLELISSYDAQDVVINNQRIPLQSDTTAPLAYRLSDSAIWKVGLKRFIFGDDVDNHVLMVQPYQAGRIPVVLVHGTGSSPVWWAEMVNTLRNDPLIRSRFQFWFYEYTSNLPILASAADLRDVLTGMEKQLDPEHKDPAMQQMIVIGHSQGGLLTRMTAIESGDKLWKSISDVPFEELKVEPGFKDALRRVLFFKPLPFVKRTVFISTPHRGSFLTQDWVRNLTRNVVGFPARVIVNSSEKFQQLISQLKLSDDLKSEGMPTAVDGMSPKNPVMQAALTIPLASDVTGNSIIPVLPEMDIKTGNDGVVEYSSAHLDGVESEFIVRTGHSAQGHPLAIEEVRRILIKHCRGLPSICGDTSSETPQISTAPSQSLKMP